MTYALLTHLWYVWDGMSASGADSSHYKRIQWHISFVFDYTNFIGFKDLRPLLLSSHSSKNLLGDGCLVTYIQ